MPDHKLSTKCRVCGGAIEAFMTFGRMPIANGFLKPNEVADEYFFELAPAFCDTCKMFQIVEQPDATRMFHENYAFYSSTSRYMQAHFERYANFVVSEILAGRPDPFVVELGSNDGIMLRHFHDKGMHHLGIEPSANVADEARARGIRTISKFFNPELADEIIKEHGRADAILAANVMCHIPDINGVGEGVKRLLKPDGVFMFEDPYLGDMIAKTSYDQIYDEHVFIFSATSVQRAFAPHGLELIDVLPQVTHGGSMRYVFAPKGGRPVAPRVEEQLAKESAQGLERAETYRRFKENCEKSRAGLMQTLEALRREGKRVVGYGAPGKGNTLLNYCGIRTDFLDYTVDRNPYKQGKYLPGTHIPIFPPEKIAETKPDYVLILPWNLKDEITAQLAYIRGWGARFVVPIPEVSVL
jgi:methylation protein EvaC